MIWQVISLPNLIEFILFSASLRDDNEISIKLQCKLWLWLMAILNFWSTPKLLLGPSWSYGSWIYNHICNQCLSPQTFESRGVLDTTLYTYWLGMRVILSLSPRYQLFSEATNSKSISVLLYWTTVQFKILNCRPFSDGFIVYFISAF